MTRAGLVAGNQTAGIGTGIGIGFGYGHGSVPVPATDPGPDPDPGCSRSILRSTAAFVAVGCLLTRPAIAGDDVDLQQFKPAPGVEDVLGVQSPRTGDPGAWHAFVAFHYANVPFRLVDRASGKTAATIVGHQTSFDVGGSWTWRDRWELGAVLPLTVNQTAGDANDLDARVPGSVPAQGLGDLRLVPKARLLSGGRWALGASAPLSLPTAGGGFLGHAGPTLRPRVLAAWGAGDGLAVTGLGGLVVRSTEKILNFEQGLAMELGAGVDLPFTLGGQHFSGVAALQGEIGLTDAGAEERPLELLAGVRWISPRGTAVTLGAGPGLTRGAGTPEYRLLMMVSQGSPSRGARPPVPEDGIRVDRNTLKLAITEPVYFGTDDDLIEPRSFPILQDVAAFLRENPWIRRMRIEGHTDDEGGEQYNLNLSQLRAISIARFLVSKGADPDTLESKGYGLTRPVDTNETEEGRARNRRVEFVILEIDEEIAPAWAKAAFAPDPPEPKPDDTGNDDPASGAPPPSP